MTDVVSNGFLRDSATGALTVLGPNGAPIGSGGTSLPTGGNAGDLLVKQSSTDGDAAWTPEPQVTGTPGLRPVGAIAECFPIWGMGNPTTGPSLTSGGLRVSRFDDVVAAGKVISTINVLSASSTTAAGQTHLYFVLYDGTSRAKLGVTVDDGATGWAAGAIKSLALSAAYTPAADFVPVVGIVQVAGTPNALVSAGGIASNTIPDSVTAALGGFAPGGNTPNTGLTGDPALAPDPFTAVAAGASRSPFYCYLS